MRNKNWEQVQASGDFEKLPVGAYVCTIKKVEDVPEREYLRIIWDVAEGDHKDHYKKDEDWSHTLTRSYKDSAAGMFKAFLVALEDSNDGFSIAVWNEDSDEKDFVGLKFGGLVQERYYTNDKGEDKTAVEIARVISVDKVKSGDYTMPKPRDNRAKVEEATVTYDTDVPF